VKIGFIDRKRSVSRALLRRSRLAAELFRFDCVFVDFFFRAEAVPRAVRGAFRVAIGPPLSKMVEASIAGTIRAMNVSPCFPSSGN
jgi:hypothetical protein